MVRFEMWFRSGDDLIVKRTIWVPRHSVRSVVVEEVDEIPSSVPRDAVEAKVNCGREMIILKSYLGWMMPNGVTDIVKQLGGPGYLHPTSEE